MGLWFLAPIIVCALVSFIFTLFAKALNNKGIIGDIANIIRWLFRHWFLILLILIAYIVIFKGGSIFGR